MPLGSLAGAQEAGGTASRGLAASGVLPRMQRSSRMAFLPCRSHGQAAQSKHYLAVPPHAATRRSPAKGLAITDEASPFALRSTRNRPRTALHPGCDLLCDRPAATGEVEAFDVRSPTSSLSAICQHTSHTTPCATGRSHDPSVQMSWGDVVRSMVLASSVWGPHSLHTAEIAILAGEVLRPAVIDRRFASVR
jgi:hypothetical protein